MVIFMLWEIVLCESYLNLKKERKQGRKSQSRSKGNTGEAWPAGQSPRGAMGPLVIYR